MRRLRACGHWLTGTCWDEPREVARLSGDADDEAQGCPLCWDRKMGAVEGLLVEGNQTESPGIRRFPVSCEATERGGEARGGSEGCGADAGRQVLSGVQTWV